MSDIGLNLSGIIALFVFLLAASGLGVGGLICLAVAFFKASKNERGAKEQGGFAYLLASIPLLLLNLIAFGVLTYLVDSNSVETNEMLDKVAV